MEPHRLRAYLLLLIVSAIWGVAGPVIKFTLQGISTIPFLTYRFFLSSLAAAVSFLILKPPIPKNKKIFLLTFLYGFLNSTVALGLLFFGLERTTVLDMTLMTTITPLVTSYFGVHFLKERITSQEKLGMAIALLGTGTILFQPILKATNGLPQLSGNILIFIYLFTTSATTVLAKKLLRVDVHPLTMVNFSFIVGFLAFFVLSFFSGVDKLLLDIKSLTFSYHLGVIFMALLSGNLAYFLSNKAQKTIEISEASLFSYLYPLFAAPLAVLWLKETITPIFILGATIILAGIVLAEYKRQQAYPLPKNLKN